MQITAKTSVKIKCTQAELLERFINQIKAIYGIDDVDVELIEPIPAPVAALFKKVKKATPGEVTSGRGGLRERITPISVDSRKRSATLSKAIKSSGATYSAVAKALTRAGHAIRGNAVSRWASGVTPLSEARLDACLMAIRHLGDSGTGVTAAPTPTPATAAQIVVGSRVRLLTEARKGFGRVGDAGQVVDILAGDPPCARIYLTDGVHKGSYCVRVINNLELV